MDLFGIVKYVAQYTLACMQQEPVVIPIATIREQLPILGASVSPVTSKLKLSYDSKNGSLNEPQSFPDQILQLRCMNVFALADFSFTGGIPETLWRDLVSIQECTLRNCSLTGSLPQQGLADRRLLRTIDFSHNKLTGEIPPAFGQLSFLTDLNLSFNEFQGRIPGELGALKWFMILDLSYNQLSEEIPHDLGKLSRLIKLNLNNNKLTGGIPYTFSCTKKGGMKGLRDLDLSHNQLEGLIPQGLGTLTHLRLLKLAHNQLECDIPETLGNLKKLRILDLSVNNLDGTLPQTLVKLKQLRRLNVSYNDLSGEVDQELVTVIGRSTQSISYPKAVYFEGTQLTGALGFSPLMADHAMVCGFHLKRGGVSDTLPYVFNLSFNQFVKTLSGNRENSSTIKIDNFLSIIRLQQGKPVFFTVTGESSLTEVIQIAYSPHPNEQGDHFSLIVNPSSGFSESDMNKLRGFVEVLEITLNPVKKRAAKSEEIIEEEVD